MCRNTEKKCMHYENGIKDEKNIWKNLSLTWHNQGYTEGYALEAKKEMANRLNDFGLPVEQIAQALNADVSMVQEWIAEPQLPKEQ